MERRKTQSALLNLKGRLHLEVVGHVEEEVGLKPLLAHHRQVEEVLLQ